MKVKDESGNRFGILTVIKRSRKKTKAAIWECICDCGNKFETRGDNLRLKISTHCGCRTKAKTLQSKGLKEGDSQFNALFSSYKSNAKRKKLDFNLTKEDFKILVTNNCYYCGVPPLAIFKKKNLLGDFKYNGIDRKLNSEGYNINNCISCCTDCNYMKSNISFENFISKVKMINKHLNL